MGTLIRTPRTPRKAKTAVDDRKLKELILYIAVRTQDDPYCGAVKLNKILYTADFRAYLELGESISGHPYVARPLGPVPKRLPPVRKNLVLSGDAELVREEMGPYSQDRVYALREAKLSLFTEEELALVDAVIEELRPLHWTQLTQKTHETPGWRAAKFGEVIPYETAFVSVHGTPAEHARARKLAAARAG
jgi:Protein of unknown function (DUF4065)